MRRRPPVHDVAQTDARRRAEDLVRVRVRVRGRGRGRGRVRVRARVRVRLQRGADADVAQRAYGRLGDLGPREMRLD